MGEAPDVREAGAIAADLRQQSRADQRADAGRLVITAASGCSAKASSPAAVSSS